MQTNNKFPERILKRFWKKVKKTRTCWIWVAGKNIGGYGKFSVRRKQYSAHRFSYEIHYGQIQKGMMVCHKCDLRKCVRPDHLFLGTHADNMKDMAKKNRTASGINAPRFPQLIENYDEIANQPEIPLPKKSPHNVSKKLTKEDVLAIRAIFATKRFCCPDIAKFFSVHKTTIWDIVKRKTWKHI